MGEEGVGQNSFAFLSDTKAANTQGGTFTSGAWQTRTLNTEDYDPDGIVSISSNQFTLQAGTYLIKASAPAYHVDRHKIKVVNMTDTSDAIIGTSAYTTSATGDVQTRSFAQGIITIASAKAFEIQHRAETTQATNGMGIANNFSVSEIYTTVEIEKLS
jgi:hypothetical protein